MVSLAVPSQSGRVRSRTRAGSYIQIAPLSAIFVVLFALPVLLLFWVSLWRYDPSSFQPTAPTLENYVRFFTDPFYLSALGRTIVLALITTFVTICLAYPTALIMARSGAKVRAFMIFLVLLPLLISVVVRVFGWMVILGDTGVINKFLLWTAVIDRPLAIMGSMNAVVIGLAQVEMAFAVMPIFSSLAGVNKHLEEAAGTLGAKPWQTFRLVILPLSMPGVAGAATLVFSLSAAAFVQPQLLGGSSFFVMTTLIYQQVMATLNWPFAAALGLILLLTSVFTLSVIGWMFRKFTYQGEA